MRGSPHSSIPRAESSRAPAAGRPIFAAPSSPPARRAVPEAPTSSSARPTFRLPSSSANSPVRRASRSARTSERATRLPTPRASRASPTCWPSWALTRRRSTSAKRPSSPRRAPAQTASPMPTTRTSAVPAAQRTRSYAPSAASRRRAGSKSSRPTCARSPGCAAGIRRSRSESSPAAAGPRPRRLPRSDAWPSSSVWPNGRRLGFCQAAGGAGLRPAGAAAVQKPKSGSEGKLRGRPPPPVEPRSGPWRRTGSESDARRARTRSKPAYPSHHSRARGKAGFTSSVRGVQSRAGKPTDCGGRMSVRVGINGFGRIGRNFFRAARKRGADIEFVAANDVGDTKTFAHLLKYDSVLGPLEEEVEPGEGFIRVGETELRWLNEKDPAALPWKDLDVAVVVESTGLFTKREDAQKHLQPR